jgi:hypothetical protein
VGGGRQLVAVERPNWREDRSEAHLNSQTRPREGRNDRGGGQPFHEATVRRGKAHRAASVANSPRNNGGIKHHVV